MILRSHNLPGKSEVVAGGAMVVAKHPLAADAGIEILAEGGNAFDAAAATGFALTVVKPMMTCLGGVGYLLAHDAARGEQWCFDGAPRAPAAARPDSYEVTGENSDGIGLYRVRGEENAVGHRAVAAPGLVAILCGAHARFGRLPLARVLEPAIRLAAEGWPVDWVTTAHTANGMAKLMANDAAAAVFLANGRPPAWEGPDRLRQPDLAETLRQIARDGAAGFYEGEVAHAIDEDMRAHNGLLSAADLAAYPRRVEPPLRVRYREVELLFPPMPCGATTAAETLRILERFDVGADGLNSVAGLHRFAEAARLAFADRFHYLADPDFAAVPLTGLLSDGHATELAARVSDGHASFATAQGDSQPWVRFGAERPVGDPWRYDPNARPAAATAAPPGNDDESCTTHFAVVDAERNAVNCTITAGSLFGAGVMTRGAGILWNNGMTWYNPLPGAANSIAPGKRALTNMTPVLVLRDGRPYILVGAPGGRKIINAITQIVSNVVDHGLGLQAAISAPRIDVSANEMLTDVRLDPAVVAGLEARGHQTRVVEDAPVLANFSRPLGILINPADGRLHSGLSPWHMAEARAIE